MSILEEAAQTVTERGATYGPPGEHWRRTAQMWTALLSGKLREGVRLSEQDVARLYIADKLSRDVHSPKHDNALDIIGYAAGLDGLDSRKFQEDYDRHSPAKVKASGPRLPPPPCASP